MKKKFMSLALTVAMFSTLTQGVYATVGYDNDNDDDDAATVTTVVTTTTAVSAAEAALPVNQPVATAAASAVAFSEDRTIEVVVTPELVASAVTSAINNAVASAVTTGSSASETVAVVTLQNVDVITPAALSSIASSAVSSGVTATVAVEKTVGGVVVATIEIDPVVAAALGTDIKLNVETDSPSTRAVFDLFFDNNLAIASFDQPKSFGMEIETKIKLDMSSLNTAQGLTFNSYNTDTNTFVTFTPEYTITPDGFISFKSSLASDVLISDKALTVKGN